MPARRFFQSVLRNGGKVVEPPSLMEVGELLRLNATIIPGRGIGLERIETLKQSHLAQQFKTGSLSVSHTGIVDREGVVFIQMVGMGSEVEEMLRAAHDYLRGRQLGF